MNSYVLRIVFFVFLMSFQFSKLQAQDNWKANWITEAKTQDSSNLWHCFRKEFSLENVPTEALAKIAVDSKYWLWINGELAVFEGGLKRGPNPKDTYYDEIDIASYLIKGKNTISVLAWYFGKDGFSHKSSGSFGFLFECITPAMQILSDKSWKAKQHTAYETCPLPKPNHRLPESSIRFDARKDFGLWYKNHYDIRNWSNAKELGTPPMAPWNDLVLRPIPFWKDYGLTSYTNNLTFPIICNTDTVITGTLPANLHNSLSKSRGIRRKSY